MASTRNGSEMAEARGWGWGRGLGSGGGAMRGGATGRVGVVRGRRRSPDSQVPLTEIGGLHSVVEVLGRPRGNAVGAPDPRGQGTASCPVRAVPRPRLMPQNVHQSPRGGRATVSGLGVGVGAGRGRAQASSRPPPFSLVGESVRSAGSSPLATPFANVNRAPPSPRFLRPHFLLEVAPSSIHLAPIPLWSFPHRLLPRQDSCPTLNLGPHSCSFYSCPMAIKCASFVQLCDRKP